MNKVLARWNSLDQATAAHEALPCCGSRAWATALVSARPIADETSLVETSASIWLNLPEQAWQEAFDSHPRIGQNHAQTHATEESLRWSAQEQQAALAQDDHAAKLALEDANRRYEEAIRPNLHRLRFRKNFSRDPHHPGKRDCKTTLQLSYSKQPNNNARSHSFAFIAGWGQTNHGHLHTHSRHRAGTASRRRSHHPRSVDRRQVVVPQ